MNVEPTISGIATAWRMPLTDALREAHKREFGYEDAGIDQWVINGPYHPAWAWWHVGCIHLRPIEGAPPPNKSYPEAEHEFFIWSLKDAPDIDALTRGILGSMHFLQPPDVIFQFDGLTDDQAKGLVEVAVSKIVSGQSCDSDFRGWWMDHLRRSVELVKRGAS